MSASTLRRSKTALNPDEDFVLHGKNSSYWNKPSYLKNSELTATSSRLSQHSLFHPDKYRDRKYTHSLSDLAHNLESLSREVKQSLDKSVTFDDLRQSKSLRESLQTDVTEEELLDDSRRKRSENSFDAKPLYKDESQWYTSPIQTTYLPRTEFTPHKSPSRTMGSVLAMEFRDDGSRRTKILQKYPLSRSESEALTYYPNTLGSSFELEKMDCLLSRSLQTISGLKVRPKTADGLNKSKSVTLKEPLKDNFDESQSVDKLYLMTSEAPTIGSAPAMITSPYDIELANLRMERLRIEEERLMELKRLSEVEKLRGPRQKWYESKGVDFNYESHKNTEMIKYEKHWEDLMSYRNELISSMDCGNPNDSNHNIYRDL